VPSFREYNLIQPLQTALVRLKINEPTKIQAQALPLLLAKHSAIITSQTGSGKTLCYLLPTLNNLDYNDQQTQCIVLLPTKELAKQIYSKYYEFKLNLPSLRLTLCTGGSN
jgi:ATP-dependent RNA helicase CshB